MRLKEEATRLNLQTIENIRKRHEALRASLSAAQLGGVYVHDAGNLVCVAVEWQARAKR